MEISTCIIMTPEELLKTWEKCKELITAMTLATSPKYGKGILIWLYGGTILFIHPPWDGVGYDGKVGIQMTVLCPDELSRIHARGGFFNDMGEPVPAK